MRPTLYADDVEVSPVAMGEAAQAARRILPHRCPHPDCKEGRIMVTGPCPDAKPYDNADGFEISCLVLHWVGADHNICDGRGWLYPDPPDWWDVWSSYDETLVDDTWQQHLRFVYRAMGILE